MHCMVSFGRDLLSIVDCVFMRTVHGQVRHGVFDRDAA